ncbi:unnamed protein product, partial [Cladocopium goreaui]
MAQEDQDNVSAEVDLQEATDMLEVPDDAQNADMAADSSVAGTEDQTINVENFGTSMELLQMTQSELFALGASFEKLLAALGGDRDRLGDAIYGTKTSSLVTLKDSFITPRAVLSLALFNGFRVLGHKSQDPEELRLFVETLAFKHLGLDVQLQRVTSVIDGFLELCEQNVRGELLPGSGLAWRKLLTYTGSCFRYVNTTSGERLKVIKADWETIASAGEQDTGENHSFAGMCAFSMGIMGEEAEGAR